MRHQGYDSIDFWAIFFEGFRIMMTNTNEGPSAEEQFHITPEKTYLRDLCVPLFRQLSPYSSQDGLDQESAETIILM